MHNLIKTGIGGSAQAVATGTYSFKLHKNNFLEWILFIAGTYPFNINVGTTLNGTDILNQQAVTDSSAINQLINASGTDRVIYISGLPNETIVKYKIS